MVQGSKVRQKVFLRKTKAGNIVKVVREHYLRNDIGCGSEVCSTCYQSQDEKRLSSSPVSKSSRFQYPHYLVLDTCVILNQIDVVEADTLCDVIIPQTVLEETKNRSPAIYKRLRAVISNTSRNFFVFQNEFHEDTHVLQQSDETSNDRNDRAIRRTVEWYQKHLDHNQKLHSDNHIKVLLVTDDNENKRRAEAENVLVATIRQYVGSLVDCPELQDKMVSLDQMQSFDDKGKAQFPKHLSLAEIQRGIKAGKYHSGTFYASRENCLEGSVNVESYEKSVLIQGRVNLNRAIDGDIVAIKILPQDQWRSSSDIVLEDDDEGEGNLNEEALETQQQAKDVQPTGVVVGIIQRKWRQYCGILQVCALEDATHHIFIPSDRKIPKVRIETRQYKTLKDQRIVVSIDSWPYFSRYPQGHYIRALGKIGDKNTENEVLLLEHDVPHNTFSQAVLSCLPTLPWLITDEDVARRVDLRHVDICSVDPPGCTDIDDALHCMAIGNGNYEVGVHIADVSHFIRPGTAIDKEAAHRATTVYLVDKRIDMVPELLSSNLCSLRGNEERFAFSCIWELSPNAEIINTRFCKSIIRSRRAMTYEEAQIKIDDKTQTDNLAVSLRHLNSLAKILKKRRLDNGALVLASPEIRFNIDSETHDPIDVKAKQLLETNSMVEEFMLLANISVAEKILEEFPECAMLRRHPEPAPANFEPLVKAGSVLGFELKTSCGKELATSLDTAVNPANPYLNTMLRILATRCMNQAVYFPSGMQQREDFFHYGLAVPVYTHFTSPIRRYADIIVHRLLAVCIGADSTYPDLLDKKKSQELCNNLNYRNRMAQYAGRASVALHTHIFFRERVQDEQGYILYVRKNALQVLIPKYGFEGTVYLLDKDMPVKFVYDRELQTQTWKHITFKIFDPVTVRLSLDRSNVQHEKLVMKLVEPYIPGLSISKDDLDKRKGSEETVNPKKKSKH
ncbi:exosome complex exonuclease RRP44 [Schistocerca gregaria]|uniref:exosome complex exonuclease RRP44 n=1 Tax=Schistocerca gregaria TaxID=7010 RepID=UPI00211F0C1B|nr:exosome complex exonuclease RRP44 [Schistocerca gregaria]